MTTGISGSTSTTTPLPATIVADGWGSSTVMPLVQNQPGSATSGAHGTGVVLVTDGVQGGGVDQAADSALLLNSLKEVCAQFTPMLDKLDNLASLLGMSNMSGGGSSTIAPPRSVAQTDVPPPSLQPEGNAPSPYAVTPDVVNPRKRVAHAHRKRSNGSRVDPDPRATDVRSKIRSAKARIAELMAQNTKIGRQHVGHSGSPVTPEAIRRNNEEIMQLKLQISGYYRAYQQQQNAPARKG